MSEKAEKMEEKMRTCTPKGVDSEEIEVDDVVTGAVAAEGAEGAVVPGRKVVDETEASMGNACTSRAQTEGEGEEEAILEGSMESEG